MFIVPIEPMRLIEFPESGKTIKQGPKNDSFRNVLDNAITALNETQEASRYDAYQLALGNADNLGEIMIHTIKAETMIQTTVQITARVITAYKEIMNIQI